MQNIYTKALITWALFIPIAITNGIIREITYKTIIGESSAHLVSTLIAGLTFILLTYFMLRHQVLNKRNSLLFLIGIFWVLMTILFEFIFGHYIDKQPWERLFFDYNIFKGRVWGLFLILISISLLLIKRIQQARR